jgi:arabinan endo-1,5-alpha-L-arabinosidase
VCIIGSCPHVNAVDTNLFNDGNGTKVSYGSFINGMFQVNLDANLKTHSVRVYGLSRGPSLTTSQSLPGAHLAAGKNQPAEGGFLYKPKSSPYYFFFFSDGVTMEKGVSLRHPFSC